jgi:UDP-N-acetyl-D-mannosaminuronic acid dehydrogenase
VDDLRESPAVEVVELLAKDLQLSGAPIELRVVEPFVAKLPHDL